MAPQPRERGLMLFDADCGFCTRSSAKVHLLGVDVARASIQETDLGPLGIEESQALVEIPYVHPDGRVEYGHRAWVAILATGPLPVRGLGRLMRTRAVDPVAARVYRWVSEHRDRMPGGTPECSLENRPGPGPTTTA